MDFISEDFLGMEEEIIIANGGGAQRKRRCTSSSKKIKTHHSPALVDPIALKEVQCAFYGMQRLRHSMDIINSMSVLVSSNCHIFFTFFSY